MGRSSNGGSRDSATLAAAAPNAAGEAPAAAGEASIGSSALHHTRRFTPDAEGAEAASSSRIADAADVGQSAQGGTRRGGAEPSRRSRSTRVPSSRCHSRNRSQRRAAGGSSSRVRHNRMSRCMQSTHAEGAEAASPSRTASRSRAAPRGSENANYETDRGDRRGESRRERSEHASQCMRAPCGTVFESESGAIGRVSWGS